MSRLLLLHLVPAWVRLWPAWLLRSLHRRVQLLQTIRFKSNFPKGSEYRRLSNLCGREFTVVLPQLVGPRPVTFTSVEGLYQGLKYTLTEQFGRGQLLDGERGVDTLVAVTSEKANKYRADIQGGFDGKLSCMVAKAIKPPKAAPQDDDGVLERLQRQAGLEAFAHRVLLKQNDKALVLLACQLLMYSENEAARVLLLSTGRYRLEEQDDTGDFWSISRDGTVGRNANGQNLMLIRRLLQTSGAGGGSSAEEEPVLRRLSTLAHAIFSELEDLMLGRRAGSCRWNPLDVTTGLETRGYEEVLLQVEQELAPH